MKTPSPTVKVRRVAAAKADCDGLATLVNAAFGVYPFLTVPRTSPEGVAEELGDSGEFILAEDAGGLVGCAMIRPSLDINWEPEGATDVRAESAMYLGLVSILPRLMGQGLGRALVVEAERLSAERGFRQVVLGTLVEMGNVDYYERLGYRVAGHEDLPAGHWGMAIPHRFCGMVKDL